MRKSKLHQLAWNSYRRGYADAASDILSNGDTYPYTQDDLDSSPAFHAGRRRAVAREVLPDRLPLDVWVRVLANESRPH